MAIIKYAWSKVAYIHVDLGNDKPTLVLETCSCKVADIIDTSGVIAIAFVKSIADWADVDYFVIPVMKDAMAMPGDVMSCHGADHSSDHVGNIVAGKVMAIACGTDKHLGIAVKMPITESKNVLVLELMSILASAKIKFLKSIHAAGDVPDLVGSAS